MDFTPPRIVSPPRLVVLIGLVMTARFDARADAQGDLAAYFGFDGLEILAVGDDAGPIASADMDGDGLNDLLVVNNHDSRIEVHFQRRGARPELEPAPARVNELPEHWRFRRVRIPVTHHVTAVVPLDVDGDGLLDLVYAGYPGEIVFIRQTERGRFEVARRHRQKQLSATRDGLAVADLVGDERPELIAILDDSIYVWTLGGSDGMELESALRLFAGDGLVAFVLEDFDGDGGTDLAAVLPDDDAPVRLWLAAGGAQRTFGPQLRFEMPPIREAQPVRLPGEAAAQLGVIEGPSKRIVTYAMERTAIEGEHSSALLVHGFTSGASRSRTHAVADLDGDGLEDLVVTDPDSNAVLSFRQRPGGGFDAGTSSPSLSDLAAIAAGPVDGAGTVFVMSEKEGVVGRSAVPSGGGTLPFPRPLEIASGATPTAMSYVELDGSAYLAVVTKDSRDYGLELLDLAGGSRRIDLGKLSRAPSTILAIDADQDDHTDLLLFTDDRPMIMVRADERTDSGYLLVESDAMGQFGLVKAASSDNIAVHDIDGDGHAELLIADRNFVRAVRYDSSPANGVAAGWQVVTQMNVDDEQSSLVSLAVLGSRIVAADKDNDRLVMMDGHPDAGWRESASIPVTGFDFDAIHAGRFGPGASPGLLAVGADGFAAVQLEGTRYTLRETNAWRTSVEQRMEHELITGDVNSDGFTDVIALDAGEQMCEIFTFTERGVMLYATGFTVFESRIFSGGDVRQYQPSMGFVEDVTGDGAADLVLLAHDRVLLYPQMMRGEAANR